MADVLFQVGVASVRSAGPARTISGVTVTGTEEMAQVLKQLSERAAPAMAKALTNEAERIMGEAKDLCPVDTGTLKASGHVQEPELIGERVSVTMGFGGAASDYAIIVHEDLSAYHPVGQAKFLEQPLMEAAGSMESRIVESLQS